MANVLGIYENVIATVATTERFFLALSDYDHKIKARFISISDLTGDDLGWCDILLMIRPNNAAFGRIARIVRDRGTENDWRLAFRNNLIYGEYKPYRPTK